MRFSIILLLSFLSILVSSQTLYEDAERSLLMKDYPETIRLCNSFLETEPGRNDVKLILGMAYQGMQDYQSALEIYKSIDVQENISLQYFEAECFESLGDISSATGIYSSILEKDTTDMYALRNIARIKLRAKKYESAKEYYIKLVEKYPDIYIFQKNLGICNYQLNEEFFALNNFRAAWELNKKDLELPINIANVYVRIQEPQNAIKILEEGLEYDSTNIAILKTSAFIYYKGERYNSAEKRFKKVLSLGDSTLFTRKYLGISEYNENKYIEAALNLKEAYHLDTLDSETTYYLGLTLTTMHGKMEGIDFLEKTIDLMTPVPDSVFLGSVYAYIGRAWADINERENSITYYAIAIKYDPSQPIYIYEKAKMHDQLGTMHNNREQLNTAIKEYERYLKIQIPIVEEIRISRGLDLDQISSPGIDFSRERIKKIKNELFFLGSEEK